MSYGKKEKKQLGDLPDEVLSLIFSDLPPSEVVRCSITCGFFHRIANDNLLWKEFCRRDGIILEMPETVRDYKAHYLNHRFVLKGSEFCYAVGNSLIDRIAKITGQNAWFFLEKNVRIFTKKEDAIKWAIALNAGTNYSYRSNFMKLRPVFSLQFSNDFKALKESNDLGQDDSIEFFNLGNKEILLEKLVAAKIEIKMFQIGYYGNRLGTEWGVNFGEGGALIELTNPEPKKRCCLVM